MWEIWKERNRHKIQNYESSMISFFNEVEAAISEVMNCHLCKILRTEGIFSEWDGMMRKSWQHLINPPLLYPKRDSVARKECKWVAPLKGWKKLKFDRASRGNPRKIGRASCRERV